MRFFLYKNKSCYNYYILFLPGGCMYSPSIFCSGLFPYLFQSPTSGAKAYPTVIAVFTDTELLKSTHVFFSSKMQIITFISDHFGFLDTDSKILLSRVVNDYHLLPFEADHVSPMTSGIDVRIFFVLAHCLDKISAAPPVNPQLFMG